MRARKPAALLETRLSAKRSSTHVPELLRLRGDLLVSTDPKEAERCFARALELVQSQSSRSCALRAAMSLYRSQRRKSGARTLEELRRLGFDTLDLLDAKVILAGR